VVFPAHEPVDVGLDGVELGAPADPRESQLRRFDVNDERNDPGRRVRERRLDGDGAEHFEVEERLRRRLDGLGRVRLALADVERPPDRRLFDERGLRTVPVGIEAHDRDRAEDGPDSRRDGERVVDRVRAEIGLRGHLELRVRVPAVLKLARDGVLRLLVVVFVEAAVGREGIARRDPHRVGVRDRQRVDPVDLDEAVEGGRPLVDDDVDAHVLGAEMRDPRGAGVRLEKAAAPVVSLDPREIALEHRLVVERVVVDGAAEETEKLGGRGGCQPVGDVVGVERVHAVHADGVDCDLALRHPASDGPDERDGRQDCESREDGEAHRAGRG
jgi:hypothetical protein